MQSKHIIGEALTVTLQTSERALQIEIQNCPTILHPSKQWNCQTCVPHVTCFPSSRSHIWLVPVPVLICNYQFPALCL